MESAREQPEELQVEAPKEAQGAEEERSNLCNSLRSLIQNKESIIKIS